MRTFVLTSADRSSAGSRTGRRRFCDERGAILVHVAVAFTGLLAFSALSIDLGVLWAARRQAQNAADSAAMAGAVSLAYVDPSNEDYAKDAARAVAAEHQIWGAPPATPDPVVGACPPGAPTGGACVQVQVARTLPNYIARLFGFSVTDVAATGTAQVMRGNATPCLRPFAMPDRWTNNVESTPPPNPGAGDVFERYVDAGGQPESQLLTGTVDVYNPPGPTSSGSGYSFSQVGERLELALAPYPAQATQADTFFPLDLDRESSTGNVQDDFLQNVLTCSGVSVSVGDQVMTDLDIHPQYFDQGLSALIAADPGAYWNGTRVVSSVINSPRVIAVAVYDPDQFRQTSRTTQRVPLLVRNLVGIFIEDFYGGVIHGVMVMLPGRYNPDGGQLSEDASFLRTVALVR
jgi:Flp pilus assembly protein TadG